MCKLGELTNHKSVKIYQGFPLCNFESCMLNTIEILRFGISMKFEKNDRKSVKINHPTLVNEDMQYFET